MSAASAEAVEVEEVEEEADEEGEGPEEGVRDGTAEGGGPPVQAVCGVERMKAMVGEGQEGLQNRRRSSATRLKTRKRKRPHRGRRAW